MPTITLRQQGEALVFDMPQAFTYQLDLKSGSTLDVELDGSEMVVRLPTVAPDRSSQGRNRYTMDELLARGGYTRHLPPEQREWVDAPSTGRELI